jgi:hypothetical protein
MRKIIVTIFSIFVAYVLNAQTEKGDWLVGGRVDLNTGENSTQIAFNPGAGYFFAKNFAAGGNFAINYVKSGDLKTTSFGIGPFARYYFTTSNTKPLVHGAFNYISAKVKAPGNTSITNNGSNFLLAGGVALFINENVAVEILAGYSHTKYKDFEGSGGFNLGIGFQVYLSKRQVENVTK